MKESSDAVAAKTKQVKYPYVKRDITFSLLFAFVQGILTFFFLSTVYATTLANTTGGPNDPTVLLPFIIVMAAIAMGAAYVLLNDDPISRDLFIVFMILWLVIGFGSYYWLVL